MNIKSFWNIISTDQPNYACVKHKNKLQLYLFRMIYETKR